MTSTQTPPTTPAPPRPYRRLALAALLGGLACSGLPGQAAEALVPAQLESFWLAPSPLAMTLIAGFVALLIGAVATVILLDPIGEGAPDEECPPPVLGVPTTLPTRVSTAADGGHVIRLTYLPALPAEAATKLPGLGLPVLAPAAGVVMRAVDDRPDAAPGWGNQVLIKLDSGGFLRLANLARNSIAVLPGQRVAAGALIAGCGWENGAAAAGVLVSFQQAGHDRAFPLPFRFAGFIELAPDGPRWIDEAAPLPGAVIRGVRPMPSVSTHGIGRAAAPVHALA